MNPMNPCEAAPLQNNGYYGILSLANSFY